MTRKFQSSSVCVATYKRPSSLRSLLYTLGKLIIPNNHTLEVIIIDNDVLCSARDTVENFITYSNLNVFYHVEPLQNIALARNLAIAKSVGEVLLFVDDDETVDPQWLINHLKALSNYKQASVIVGPVIPIYRNGCPKWIKQGSFFSGLNYDDGYELTTAPTNNTSVIKKDIPNECIFDMSFGLTGGSDSDFFRKLHKYGLKIIFSMQPKVYEETRSERESLKWLLRRNFRYGQNTTRIRRKYESLPRQLQFIFTSILATGWFFIVFISTISFSKILSAKYILKFSKHLGAITGYFGIYYREYKNHNSKN